MIIIRDDGDTAIRVLAGDPPGEVFAGHQAALPVPGEPVGLIGGLLHQGGTCPWRPLHAPVVTDIAEDETALFLPPHRPLGWSALPTEATRQFFDLLVQVDNTRESWSMLLDWHMPLLPWLLRRADGPRQTGGGHQ